MSTDRRTEIRDSPKMIVIGTLVGWLMRVCSWSLRMDIESRWNHGEGETAAGPVIYALWHNRFFTVPPAFRKVYGKNRRCVVLTSASHDGAMVARAMAVFGFEAVRGSSSRRGAAALVALTRAVRSGLDACITPDGPRGPRYEVHPGMVKLAVATGAPIIPIHVTFSSAWRLKTWDRFVIPKPFSRVRIVFDLPLVIDSSGGADGFEQQRLRVERAMIAGVDDLTPP
jgi:lysophospholipid acyltransferase (LPLAT)-like uncharacterized protein